MPQVDLFDQGKQKVGTIDLSDAIFGVPVNIALVHQVIKAQLAGRRRGTAKTKVKSEVRGGGRKPFRQKGTGRARQGSSRSPLHPGGGQTFGPVVRDYSQATPKEMIRGALRSALTDRLLSNRLLVVNEFVLPTFKTKPLFGMLRDGFQVEKVLIVDHLNFNLERAARNLMQVKVLRIDGLNVYDIIRNEWLILTQRAVQEIEQRLAPRSLIEQCVS